MTIDECRRILAALFDSVDYVTTTHLSGGGEPFLHPQLAELIDVVFEYNDKFDKCMLFTNSAVKPSQALLDAITRHSDKTIIQLSRYGINPERELEVLTALEATGASLKVEKYYGDNQSFGGWVNFGDWQERNRSTPELADVFANCAVTRDMRGNWRTRDGKTHWCSRSQRGMELGLIPDCSADYVDLLDDTSRDEKRFKFANIAARGFLSACDHCSGNQGTDDYGLRYQAAEQL
jgi:hypothetical protein